MEKIKDVEVKRAIFDCLHMVMFMSINPNETIQSFKACGREMVVEVLIIYNFVLLGQDISLCQNMASMTKLIQPHMAQMTRNGISNGFNSTTNGIND
jgi:Na+/glutamate symporter